MDPELLALQNLFAAAQEAKSAARLSERNVVELVTKLQQLKLLDSNLLHTVTGKEYLTQERLRTEVDAEVKRLGRVSLIDLAATIGVDLYHVEKQAEQVVASNPDLALVQGEILSSSFWDNMAEEVNQTLQEAGHLPLAELAKRFSVGAELLSAALDSRLGKLIDGKLEGGQLYTPAFVSRVQAMIRGCTRALTVPTPLSAIWISVQQQLREGDKSVSGTLGEGGLFHSLLNSLVADEAVLGTLRGGGALWTPLVFLQSQRDSIGVFYSQNGFIAYENLRKLAVPQPKQYLQANYQEGIALDSVFVHPSFINVVDAAAEEAVNGGGWFDALALLPSSFGTSDAAKVVSMCPSVQKAKKDGHAEVFADTCVVSNLLVKGLFEKFEAEMRKSAQSKVAASQTLVEGAKTLNLEAQPDRKSSTAGDHSDEVQNDKSGRRSKGKVVQPASKSKGSSDKQVEEGSKGSKSRRKGKVKGGHSMKDEGQPDVSDSGRLTLEEEAGVPSFEHMVERILEWYPDMETAGADDGESGKLATILTASLRPALVSSWFAMKRAIFSARTDDRRRRLESLQQKIGETYANLQLYTKAVELFEEDKAISVVLLRHLLRTVASEIVDVFLHTQVLESRLDRGEVVDTADELTFQGSFSAGQRLSMAKSLPVSSHAKAATAMVEALEGKDIDAFDDALDSAITESGLRLRKLDKKSERALLHAHRKVLQNQVLEETDPIALLPKVVGLLFIQVYNKALQAPGRALTAAVGLLEKSMAAQSFDTLQEYHSATVRVLQSADEGETAPDTLEERVTLRSKMADLKALVDSSRPANANGNS